MENPEEKKSEAKVEQDAAVGTEMTGEVDVDAPSTANEDRFDRDAKLREDDEGPLPKSPKRAQSADLPRPDASLKLNDTLFDDDTAQPAKGEAFALSENTETREIEGSVETGAMSAKGRKFTTSRHNPREQAISDAAPTAPNPWGGAPDDAAKESGRKHSASRRGKQAKPPPQAGRGLSTKFAARRPAGQRGPRAK